MQVINSAAELRACVEGWYAAGQRVALVPTMGNLHAGHLSLVEEARRQASRIVLSVYVNPTQFGAGEDLDRYPRTLEADTAAASQAGVDLLFVPDDAEVYPYGVNGMTEVRVPALSDILCGAGRPGHFDGVTSVVCRLLNMVRPDFAVFGQKDFQQLQIIRRMVADLHLSVRIVDAATVRHNDGLALSSRNHYLSTADRARAPALFGALKDCAARLEDGERNYAELAAAGRAGLAAAGLVPEYFEILTAETLAAPKDADSQLVVMAAAQCGAARLIDNLQVDLTAL